MDALFDHNSHRGPQACARLPVLIAVGGLPPPQVAEIWPDQSFLSLKRRFENPFSGACG